MTIIVRGKPPAKVAAVASNSVPNKPAPAPKASSNVRGSNSSLAALETENEALRNTIGVLENAKNSAEMDRKFYYEKLRSIEVYLQEKEEQIAQNPDLKHIQDILYQTDVRAMFAEQMELHSSNLICPDRLLRPKRWSKELRKPTPFWMRRPFKRINPHKLSSESHVKPWWRPSPRPPIKNQNTQRQR